MPIYVVSHKQVDLLENLPENYIPLYVGEQKKELTLRGGISDDSGDNISSLNSSFCELTALYWIWKNDCSGYKGLVHYRRFFEFNSKKEILSFKHAVSILEKKEVIIPKKYWLLENVKKHYAHHHNAADLELLRSVIKDLYPSDVVFFDSCMSRKYVYPYNMFIAKKEFFDSYCSWLFSILFEIKRRKDEAKEVEKNTYQERVYGFLSERMMNIYIQKTMPNYQELPIFLTDKNLKRDITMNLACLLSSHKDKSK